MLLNAHITDSQLEIIWHLSHIIGKNILKGFLNFVFKLMIVTLVSNIIYER